MSSSPDPLWNRPRAKRRGERCRERRQAAIGRERSQEEALLAALAKARANSAPGKPGAGKSFSAPPRPPKGKGRLQPVRETEAERQANNQLASRGSVIRIDTHDIQYRLHVEESTPSALLNRHYRGAPQGMREAHGWKRHVPAEWEGEKDWS